MIRKSFPVTTKVVDEDQGIVEAVVNCTAIVDFQKDLMEPGCWGAVIKSAEVGDTQWPSLVWSHEWSQTTGKVLAAEEIAPEDPRLKSLKIQKGSGALRIVARYNLGTQRGREAFSDVKFGAVNQWSVGFLTAPDGEVFDSKGIRHVTKVGVWPEVSNVLVGASPGTYTAIAKSALTSTDRLSAGHEIEQRYLLDVESKDYGVPVLTGDEAIHNKPLTDALAAIKTLIQQELAEDEPEFDCVNQLSGIALQLQGWAMGEVSEYTSMASEAIETKEVVVMEDVKPDEQPKVDPVPEPEPEPVFNIDDPATWPEWLIPALTQESLLSPQQSDPDNSGEVVLTHFGRRNTRTGEEQLH